MCNDGFIRLTQSQPNSNFLKLENISLRDSGMCVKIGVRASLAKQLNVTKTGDDFARPVAVVLSYKWAKNEPV